MKSWARRGDRAAAAESSLYLPVRTHASLAFSLRSLHFIVILPRLRRNYVATKHYPSPTPARHDKRWTSRSRCCKCHAEKWNPDYLCSPNVLIVLQPMFFYNVTVHFQRQLNTDADQSPCQQGWPLDHPSLSLSPFSLPPTSSHPTQESSRRLERQNLPRGWVNLH